LRPLYLSGFNVRLNVDRARLIVRDGFHTPDDMPEELAVEPRRAHFDSIIIDGHSGSVSLDSIKWLMRHGVPIYLLDYDGTLLSSTLPNEPVNGPLKIAQMEAYNDPVKRLRIAKKLVEAKSQRTIDLLAWLGSRYEDLGSAQEDARAQAQRIGECNNLPKLMQVEGSIADIYWHQLSLILPEELRFHSRLHETRQMNSSDPVNSLLNYSYAILESECRRALNSVGLEPTIGFLHEARQTKHPLVYDLQEPFRWLVDAAIIGALESRRFGRKDFYRLDNYVLRLRPDAARRLLDILQIKFNATIQYRGKHYSWNTILRLKCQELAGYVLSQRNELDFGHPCPTLSRDDSEKFRNRILSLSVAEARELGIRKNTLWYMQQRARTSKQMRIYNLVKDRLAQGNITS
jgi:CRISPR-associated protein Cas1